MRSTSLRSFWEQLIDDFSTKMSIRIVAFYGSVVALSTGLSMVLPHEIQVSSSIAAGFAVSFLLVASMILSQGFTRLDLVFIGAIIFLLVALLKRGLLPPSILQNFGHYALILSLAFSSSYVGLRVRQGGRIGSHAMSVKSLGDFFSISWITLSSELCYCLHPIPMLEMLGVMALIPSQVRLGFVIMASTLAHQVRLTYGYYKARRMRAAPRTEASKQERNKMQILR